MGLQKLKAYLQGVENKTKDEIKTDLENVPSLSCISLSDSPLRCHFLDTESKIFVLKFDYCYWVENKEVSQLTNAVLVLNDWQENHFKQWNNETENYENPTEIRFFDEISESISTENEIVLKGFTPDSVWTEWTFVQAKISLLYTEKVFLYAQEKVEIE